MVIVTHEMSFAKAIADRVIFLDKGIIVEEGKAEEFFEYPKTERAQRFLHTFTYEKVKNNCEEKLQSCRQLPALHKRDKISIREQSFT